MPSNKKRPNKRILNKKLPTLRRPIAIPTSSNTFLRYYGIIAGTLAALFLILFGVTLLARQSWERGLRYQTQLVLDRAFPGEYLVKDRVTLTPAVDGTGATFELVPQQGRPFRQKRLGMIINVTTIFGPLPAVFVCERKNGGNAVRFAGFGFDSNTFAEESTLILNSQIPRLISLIASSLEATEGGQR